MPSSSTCMESAVCVCSIRDTVMSDIRAWVELYFKNRSSVSSLLHADNITNELINIKINLLFMFLCLSIYKTYNYLKCCMKVDFFLRISGKHLFLHYTALFPVAGFIVNIGNNESDCDAKSDCPPDPYSSESVTQVIGQRYSNQPKGEQANHHRK